jgi:hypothetical protein
MDYNAGEPSSSKACACEAERLLNYAARLDGDEQARIIAMADVYSRLAHVAVIRETATPAADRADEK